MQPAENRILIVDDNPDIHQDYAKILLDDEPCENAADIEAFLGGGTRDDTATKMMLDSAFSGEEGVEKVREACVADRPYSIAFVDMRMPPGWDGLKTTEEIWKVDPELQVVICTAYADNSWAEIVERVGRTDRLLILKKPFDAIEVSQLAVALAEKWKLSRQARLKQEDLEHLVQERTKQLQHAALHDPLTDLPNRRLFHMRLTEEISKHRTDRKLSAIALLDLDRFKLVNDTMGHPAGDELLRAVSDRLRENLRENDTIARLGGDEFALIRGGASSVEELLTEARRTVAEMTQPYSLSYADVECGASMGMAILPDHGVHPEELIRKADVALYRAKRKGRGDVQLFDPNADSMEIQTRELESDLAQAIKLGEFKLNYQPILDCRTGRVAAVEALVRWSHPTRGLLLPTEFVSLAEDTTLINPIGDWVIRKACQDAIEWPSEINLAINVSAVQFRQDDMLRNSLRNVLQETGLDPRRVEIEITEGVLLIDSEQTLATLDSLRHMGVKIVLDDFGIGYSSLNYLRRFSFDKVKLDRAFVEGLEHCEDSKIIVHAVAELGRSLGVPTTAEGVETQQQLDIVSAEGFERWQGYLETRPLPAESLPSLFQRSAQEIIAQV